MTAFLFLIYLSPSPSPPHSVSSFYSGGQEQSMHLFFEVKYCILSSGIFRMLKYEEEYFETLCNMIYNIYYLYILEK